MNVSQPVQAESVFPIDEHGDAFPVDTPSAMPRGSEEEGAHGDEDEGCPNPDAVSSLFVRNYFVVLPRIAQAPPPLPPPATGVAADAGGEDDVVDDDVGFPDPPYHSSGEWLQVLEPASEPPSEVVRIQNLDRALDAQSLCEIFRAFGEVVYVEVIHQRGCETHEGGVYFYDAECAKMAVEKLHGTILSGREVSLCYHSDSEIPTKNQGGSSDDTNAESAPATSGQGWVEPTVTSSSPMANLIQKHGGTVFDSLYELITVPEEFFVHEFNAGEGTEGPLIYVVLPEHEEETEEEEEGETTHERRQEDFSASVEQSLLAELQCLFSSPLQSSMMKIVRPQWVRDSIERGRIVDALPYALQLVIVPCPEAEGDQLVFIADVEDVEAPGLPEASSREASESAPSYSGEWTEDTGPGIRWGSLDGLGGNGWTAEGGEEQSFGDEWSSEDPHAPKISRHDARAMFSGWPSSEPDVDSDAVFAGGGSVSITMPYYGSAFPGDSRYDATTDSYHSHLRGFDQPRSLECPSVLLDSFWLPFCSGEEPGKGFVAPPVLVQRGRIPILHQRRVPDTIKNMRRLLTTSDAELEEDLALFGETLTYSDQLYNWRVKLIHDKYEGWRWGMVNAMSEIRTRMKLCRKLVLCRFQDGQKRIDLLDHFRKSHDALREGVTITGEDIDPVSTEHPLLRLITSCADALAIIFSFFSPKDLLQRIGAACRGFYAFVRVRVPVHADVNPKSMRTISLFDRVGGMKLDAFRGSWDEAKQQEINRGWEEVLLAHGGSIDTLVMNCSIGTLSQLGAAGLNVSSLRRMELLEAPLVVDVKPSLLANLRVLKAEFLPVKCLKPLRHLQELKFDFLRTFRREKPIEEFDTAAAQLGIVGDLEDLDVGWKDLWIADYQRALSCLVAFLSEARIQRIEITAQGDFIDNSSNGSEGRGLPRADRVYAALIRRGGSSSLVMRAFAKRRAMIQKLRDGVWTILTLLSRRPLVRSLAIVLFAFPDDMDDVQEELFQWFVHLRVLDLSFSSPIALPSGSLLEVPIAIPEHIYMQNTAVFSARLIEAYRQSDQSVKPAERLCLDSSVRFSSHDPRMTLCPFLGAILSGRLFSAVSAPIVVRNLGSTVPSDLPPNGPVPRIAQWSAKSPVVTFLGRIGLSGILERLLATVSFKEAEIRMSSNAVGVREWETTILPILGGYSVPESLGVTAQLLRTSLSRALDIICLGLEKRLQALQKYRSLGCSQLRRFTVVVEDLCRDATRRSSRRTQRGRARDASSAKSDLRSLFEKLQLEELSLQLGTFSFSASSAGSDGLEHLEVVDATPESDSIMTSHVEEGGEGNETWDGASSAGSAGNAGQDFDSWVDRDPGSKASGCGWDKPLARSRSRDLPFQPFVERTQGGDTFTYQTVECARYFRAAKGRKGVSVDEIRWHNLYKPPSLGVARLARSVKSVAPGAATGASVSSSSVPDARAGSEEEGEMDDSGSSKHHEDAGDWGWW